MARARSYVMLAPEIPLYVSASGTFALSPDGLAFVGLTASSGGVDAATVSGLGAVGILQAMCALRGYDATQDFDGSLALLAGLTEGSAMRSLKVLGATSSELVGSINQLAGTKGKELLGALRAWAVSGNF